MIQLKQRDNRGKWLEADSVLRSSYPIYFKMHKENNNKQERTGWGCFDKMDSTTSPGSDRADSRLRNRSGTIYSDSSRCRSRSSLAWRASRRSSTFDRRWQSPQWVPSPSPDTPPPFPSRSVSGTIPLPRTRHHTHRVGPPSSVSLSGDGR